MTRSTPTESPVSDDAESPVNDGPPQIEETSSDDASIASAPNPSTVAQGLGARFRTKPTPKKVVFDAVNWLASKTATAATAAATATSTKDNASIKNSAHGNNHNDSQIKDNGDDGNGVDGSESASGRKAPDHAKTPAPDASTQQTNHHGHHNGLPAVDQIQALMALFNQVNPKRTPIVPPTPRVGGVDSIGAWTGYGAGAEGLSPRTTNCYRKLCGDEVKSLSQLSYIESHCRAGLKGINGPLFCQEHEPGAQKTITVLTALDSFLESYGIESVFVIQFSNRYVNMIKSPTGVDDSIMDDWIHSLTISGVEIETYVNAPLCLYDRKNLELSYDAVINSCSEDLAREIRSLLSPSQRSGPQALHEILKIVYRKNDFKLEQLLNDLSKLSIKAFPAENVTLYKNAAFQILDEVEMHLPPGENLATIRSKALKGLSHSTMPFFQGFILTMMMKPNGRGSIQQLRNELAEAQLTYLNLLQQDNYPPGKQPIKEDKRLHALQAQVKTLTDKVGSLARSPDATSTTGNDTSTPDNRNNNKNKKPYIPYEKRDPNAVGPNGLTNAVSIQVKALIVERLKTMPQDLSTIPTTEEISISLDGSAVAKWCTTCRRFIIGKHMHFTKDHTNGTPSNRPAKTNPYFGQAPATTTTATGLLASLPTTPQLPVLTPGGPNPPTFQPPPSYDFSSTTPLQRGAGLVAQGVAPDDASILSDDFHDAYDLSDIDLTDADPRLLAFLNSCNVVLPNGSGR